ncbi:MAG: hypothetical protein IPH75_11420 [bacterium]|nr:hypothetical protein [bacterium]
MPHFRWIRAGAQLVHRDPALSLAVRRLFFATMLNQTSTTKWEEVVPDTYHYCQAAAKITSGFDFDSFGVQTFGPGYPLFLAFLRVITGHSPIGMMLLQILLSSPCLGIEATWAYPVTMRLGPGSPDYLNALHHGNPLSEHLSDAETLFMSLVP